MGEGPKDCAKAQDGFLGPFRRGLVACAYSP